MKTIVDYLKTNKKFEGMIGNATIKLEMHEDLLVMTCNTHIHTCRVLDYSYAEELIEDVLADRNIEVRFCEECGKPYDAGYIAGDGDWYCCEDCFYGVMNRDYGEGKWRGTDEEGYYGGYYEYLNGDEWEDTGIYYTEWNN
jgi:hypothetical protein